MSEQESLQDIQVRLPVVAVTPEGSPPYGEHHSGVGHDYDSAGAADLLARRSMDSRTAGLASVCLTRAHVGVTRVFPPGFRAI